MVDSISESIHGMLCPRHIEWLNVRIFWLYSTLRQASAPLIDTIHEHLEVCTRFCQQNHQIWWLFGAPNPTSPFKGLILTTLNLGFFLRKKKTTPIAYRLPYVMPIKWVLFGKSSISAFQGCKNYQNRFRELGERAPNVRHTRRFWCAIFDDFNGIPIGFQWDSYRFSMGFL